MAQILHWVSNPHKLTQPEQNRLTLWADRNPRHKFEIEIYRQLQALTHGADLNISQLARQNHVTRPRIMAALVWLRDSDLLLHTMSGRINSWVVRVPPKSKVKGPDSFRGFPAISLLAHSSEVTSTLTDEQLELLRKVCGKAREVAKLYVYLCRLIDAGVTHTTCTELADLLGKSKQIVSRNLHSIKDLGLGNFDYAIGTVTLDALYPEDETMSEDIHVWLEDAYSIPLPGPVAPVRTTDSVTLLLQYWEALQQARGKRLKTEIHDFGKVTTNRATVRRLMSAHTFEGVQGYITFYMLAYEDEVIQEYGRTLLTFEKNFSKIVAEAEDNAAAYKDPTKYWKLLLHSHGLLDTWGHLYGKNTEKSIG